MNMNQIYKYNLFYILQTGQHDKQYLYDSTDANAEEIQMM